MCFPYLPLSMSTNFVNAVSLCILFSNKKKVFSIAWIIWNFSTRMIYKFSIYRILPVNDFSKWFTDVLLPNGCRKLWSGSQISLDGSDLKEGTTYFLFIILGLSRPFANLWRMQFGCYLIWILQETGDLDC